jgi:hypothetical protein
MAILYDLSWHLEILEAKSNNIYLGSLGVSSGEGFLP